MRWHAIAKRIAAVNFAYWWFQEHGLVQVTGFLRI